VDKGMNYDIMETMKIIHSEITENQKQAVGFDIRELHEWEDGQKDTVYYRAGEKVNPETVMKNRVPVLEAQRAERESREAERAEAEKKQQEAVKKLDAQDVADLLMVSVEEVNIIKER
jgi:hypothetical protein